jgi:ABC-type multidrug transport system fused ATPase/permease subunit
MKLSRSNNIFLILNLFSNQDRRRIAVISFLQITLGLLDLAGVVAIGLLGSVATLGVTSTEPGGNTKRLLEFLGLEDQGLSYQISALGLTAAMVLIVKTVLSAFFSLKIINFLSSRTATISSDFIGKLLRRNLEGLNRLKPNEVLFAMSTGINTLTMGVLVQSISIVVDASLLFLLGFALLVTDPVLAIFTLAYFASISAGLYQQLNTKSRNLGRKSSDLFLIMHNRINELLGNYREITVKNLRGSYLQKIEENRDALSKVLARLSFYPNLSKYALEVGLVFGALVISSYQLVFNNSSGAVATLGVFLIASLRIAPALLRIQQSLTSMKRALGQSESTLLMLRRLQEVEPISSSKGVFQTFHKGFSPRIEFKEISFSYEGQSAPIIKNFSLNVQPGSKVAIRGKSGVGKTTLIDLMLGLLEPTNGEIQISGLSPIKCFEKWPGAVSYVPQQVLIIEGTIRENLCIGFETDLIPESRFYDSLRQCELEDLVKQLPEGLDTYIGKGGRELSGGQKQRLGIARSLMTSPKLIVLDEATSALDLATQNKIRNTLMSKQNNTTIVMISHQKNTILGCDTILDIYSRGELVVSSKKRKRRLV